MKSNSKTTKASPATEVDSSQPTRSKAPPDDWPQRWGLDGDLADESWLEILREAESSQALGSIGEYELVEEVSRGGQGIVFRAREHGSGRPIALKRLLAGEHATPGMRRRFQREVEAAARLWHPGIVSVYGMQVDSDGTIFAMEWVDGFGATEWSRGRQPDEILEVFLRLTEAVQHAHSRGVLHRDLKPSNVLIDSRSRPHVLDFGLAKVGDQADLEGGGPGLSKSAEIFGTPAYAAPEQLQGDQRRLDARADVYSLGVMLYEMLSGRSPYGEWTGVAELLRRIGQVRPASLSLLDARLGPDLDVILSRALAPSVAQRYGSVRELEEDLRRYRAGRPIRALPTSNWVLLAEALGRQRSASWAAGGLLALAVGLGLYAHSLLDRVELGDQRLHVQGLLLEAEQQRNAELMSFIPECTAGSQDMLESFAQTGALLQPQARRASRIPQIVPTEGSEEPQGTLELSPKEKGELRLRLMRKP